MLDPFGKGERVAEPLTEIERTLRKHETALRTLAQLMGENVVIQIEEILDGTKTTSEDSTGTAD
jgi:hypothetical protein